MAWVWAFPGIGSDVVGAPWVLPGRHLASVAGGRGLSGSADGKALLVTGAGVGHLIRGWQGGTIEVRLLTRGGDAAGRGEFSADGSRFAWATGRGDVISVADAVTGWTLKEFVIEPPAQKGGGRRPYFETLHFRRRNDGASTRECILGLDTANGRIVEVSLTDGRVEGSVDIGPTGSLMVSAGDHLYGVDSGEAQGNGVATLWEVAVRKDTRPVVTHRWRALRIWGSVPAAVAGLETGVGDTLAASATSVVIGRTSSGALVRLDRATRKVVAWQAAPRPAQVPLGYRGTQPEGMAFSLKGDRLYVAEAGLNAISVRDARTLSTVGYMPTPAHPYRIVVSPDGRALACLSLGGLATEAELGSGGRQTAQPWVSVLDIPEDAQLALSTARVLEQAGTGSLTPSGQAVTLPDGSGTNPEESPGPATGPSTRPLPKLRLPVEVLGLGGTRETARLTLTAMEAARASVLSLLVHGVQYEDKARLTINGGAPISINNRNVRILGNGKAFGGIGGGFHTLAMELDLPKGALRDGENAIEFEYTRQDSYAVSGFKTRDNRIDDASSGFRIVRLNLKDRQGVALLGRDRFEDDDPRLWGPPELPGGLAKAVRDGENLWRGFRADGTPYRLRNYSDIGLTQVELKATCADCHASDGRDLKYFNYSNHSIVARSRIHGLSEDEGKAIAAYVRELPGMPVVPQARPWNPPFQPGPGLDSRPGHEWPAGAGVDAVVEDPVETFNGIFPGAYTRDEKGVGRWDVSKITTAPIEAKASLSMREVPIVMQLLDWNHWLPKVHPLDAYSDTMETNAVFRSQIVNALKVYTNTVRYLRTPAGATNFAIVASFSRSMLASMAGARFSASWDAWDHTLKEAQKRYPLMLIPLVRSWEVYMEFDLGDRVAGASCGPAADKRSWRVGTLPFSASPNIAGLLDTREEGVPYFPRNGHGIGNNTGVTFNYVSTAWYHLQLILDHGNRNPLCGVNAGTPLDWAYVMAHFNQLQAEDALGSGISMMPLMYLYLAKMPQIYDTGLGVDQGNSGGWNPFVLTLKPLHQYSFGTAAHQERIWRNVPPEARARLMSVLYRVWLDKNRESTREQYFVPTISSVPESYLAYMSPGSRIDDRRGDSLAHRIYYIFTRKERGFDGTMAGFGVDPDLQNEILDWAATVWPSNPDGSRAPWDTLRPAMSGSQR